MFRRHRTTRDFDDEIQAHLALEADRLRAEGLTEAQASAASHRNFGNVTHTEERFYEAGRWSWADALWRNFRQAFRMIAHSPGTSALAIVVLALGIGANTAIFSLLNALLLRPLPVERPDQLVLFGDGRARGNTDELPNESWRLFSYDSFHQFRQQSQVFSDVAAIDSILFSTHGRIGPGVNLEKFSAELVSGSYFHTLSVRPFLGRLLTADDDVTPGGHPIAVANHAWWQRRLGGDPHVVGSTVTISSTVYTIVGVAPPGFFGAAVGQSPDLWIPLAMEKQVSPGWNGLGDKLFQSLYLVARLKPGVDLAQADANTNILFQQIVHAYAGPHASPTVLEAISHARVDLTSAATGLPGVRHQFSSPLRLLMGLVSIVLLIACANVANLLLARAAARRREIAIRMSIGARRSRVISQLLVESAVLGFGGALLGVSLAWSASRLLLAMASAGPDPLPVRVQPDLTVLAFALAITIVTVLVFGTLPAFRATRLELMSALKEGRGIVGSDRGPRGSRLTRALIVSQVALSLALLAGAGLFLHSLSNLTHLDTGFDRENVLLAGIDAIGAGYARDERMQNMMTRVEERVAAVPGVRAASFAFFVFDSGSWSGPVFVPGRPPSDRDPEVTMNIVGPQYLSALRMPVLLGRDFSPHDDAAAPGVAVINETMAREYFPGASPIGRTFQLDSSRGNRQIQVVGVVRDAKYNSFREKPQPAAFFAHAQQPGFLYHLVIRYSGDTRTLTPAIRRAIREIDPNLPVGDFTTLAEKVRGRMSTERLVAQLSTWFAVLAALLACAGIYGVMSYGIARRTNEFGVRMALGAKQADIRWMVLREAVWLALAGIALGTALAFAAAQIIRGALYEVQPFDPPAFAAAIALMIAVSLLAGWLPARRATRIEPTIALRCE